MEPTQLTVVINGITDTLNGVITSADKIGKGVLENNRLIVNCQEIIELMRQVVLNNYKAIINNQMFTEEIGKFATNVANFTQSVFIELSQGIEALSGVVSNNTIRLNHLEVALYDLADKVQDTWLIAMCALGFCILNTVVVLWFICSTRRCSCKPIKRSK